MSENHQLNIPAANKPVAQKTEHQQADILEPQELLLDVSKLDHPRPFETVMSCLKDLRYGSFVHMLHRRTPYPLLQILNENGFDFKITETSDMLFEAFIWKMDDFSTANYCKNR